MATHVGLYTGEDVRLGDLLLNQVDDTMCAWAVTDLDGWWGLPDLEVPDDPRPQSEDGSYYTLGRYLPRIISLQGRILPLDGVANKAVAARRALNKIIAPLVRSRILLSVDEEDGTRVAMVQLSAQPLTRINQATGLLEFDIQLKTVDPAKYSFNVYSPSTSLQTASPGRTYNKTFLYSYGGASTSGIINAFNSGSYATTGIFTITGPVTRPKIEHVESGNWLEFNVVLGVGESLIVNLKSKKITLSGANRRSTLTAASRWFTIDPGMNTIRYSGVQHIPANPPSVPRTMLQLSYRDAWID